MKGGRARWAWTRCEVRFSWRSLPAVAWAQRAGAIRSAIGCPCPSWRRAVAPPFSTERKVMPRCLLLPHSQVSVELCDQSARRALPRKRKG